MGRNTPPPTAGPRLFSAPWEVALGGYRVLEHAGEWWIFEALPVGRVEHRAFDGMRDPILFRHALALDLEADGALEHFCGRNGLLGLWLAPSSEVSGIRLADGTHRAERVASWVTCLGELRGVVGLGDALEGGDQAQLEELLRLEKDAIHDGDQAYHRSHPDVARALRAAGRGDRRPAARFVLARRVSRTVRKYVQLGLQVEPNSPLGLAFAIDAGGLRAALWLQVSHWLAGDVRHRACAAPGCATWFVLTPNGDQRHGRIRTCSVRCRTALSRARAKARALHAAGESVEAIAATLGTTMYTAKAWAKGK